jgi:hypothetical protein
MYTIPLKLNQIEDSKPYPFGLSAKWLPNSDKGGLKRAQPGIEPGTPRIPGSPKARIMLLDHWATKEMVV